ncbi:MAG: CPBP family intramembrane metalloprotease [Lachnospiraceae bacterium]|nr:CPBP family intramembrane metalloprotease [Lachnospiraceae bacterium]MBR4608533.1 CPBP family intramembrane metalloprotease [Lachnospiraceae bacterium]MBR6151235.1 CPBP family intramembrane metalloprotease [Lachnospiraceae bacterium]
MNPKKLLCTILLITLIPFYVVFTILTSSGRIGENVAKHKQQLNILVEDGVIADAVDFVPFLIPKEGQYQMTLDFTTVDPGFYTGMVLKDASGNPVLYNGFDTVQGYTANVTLPEGRAVLELHYLPNEQALKDFCATYPIYSEAQLTHVESKLHFNDRIKTGTWYASLSLSIDECVRTPLYVKLLVLAFSILLLVLLAVLFAKDHPAEADDCKTRLTSMGIRYSILIFAIFVLEILLSIVLSLLISPQTLKANNATLSLLLTIFIVDVIGFSLLYLITKNVPAQKLEKKPLGFGRFLLFWMMTLGLAFVGAVIGLLTEKLLPNNQSVDITGVMLGSSMFLRVLAIGILAPIFEELIFRKFMIDRLIKHGEFVAIFLSGLTFGLFHGNFQQFFFATFIGWLFAFLYIRTGNILHTILLHMAINLGTSVVTMYLLGKLTESGILEFSDPAALTQALTSDPSTFAYAGLLALWVILLFLVAFIGLIVFIVFMAQKKFALRRLEDEPTKGQILAQIFSSPYMWLLFIILLGQFITSYLPSIMK